MADERIVARLLQSPEWAELRSVFEEAKEQYMRNLAKTIYSDPSSVADADLHYKRGFFRGMEWLLNQPQVSANAIRKAADQKESE